MDELKKEILKASKKYGIGPTYEDKSVRNIQQQFDLNSAFKHQYVSEGIGLPSSFIKKYRRSRPHPAHSIQISENPNMIVLKHPKQAINDFKRQFFDSLSQPLPSTSRQRQKLKQMEIQVKVHQQISGTNNQKQKQKKSKPKKKKDVPMEVEVKNTEVLKSKYNSQTEVKSNRYQTELQYLEKSSCKKVPSAQEKFILSCETQTLPLSLPQKPKQKTQVSSEFPSVYTTSSFHNEESVWKKYLNMNQDILPASLSSAPHSASAKDARSIETAAPSNEVPTEKTFVYNEFMGFLRGHQSQPETKEQQTFSQCKNDSKKISKIDLFTKEQMLNLYERYNPVVFPAEETSIFIKAMDSIEEEFCGVEYLDQVYLNYQKFGGMMRKKDMQQKIVSDLLFVIREENVKVWNNANIS